MRVVEEWVCLDDAHEHPSLKGFTGEFVCKYFEVSNCCSDLIYKMVTRPGSRVRVVDQNPSSFRGPVF